MCVHKLFMTPIALSHLRGSIVSWKRLLKNQFVNKNTKNNEFTIAVVWPS